MKKAIHAVQLYKDIKETGLHYLIIENLYFE